MESRIYSVGTKYSGLYSELYAHRARVRFIDVYYALFIIYCALNLLKSTTFIQISWLYIDFLYLLIRIVCIGILTLHFFIERFTKMQFIILLFAGGSIAISTLVSDDWNLLILFLFFVNGRQINIQVVAKKLLYTYGILTVLTAVCSLLHIIDTPLMMSRVNTVRQTFGFDHPNTLGLTLFTICCAYAVLRFKKANLLDLCFYIIVYAFCNYVVYSRTSSIALFVLIIVTFISVIAKGIYNQIFSIIALMFFMALCLFSFYLMTSYNAGIGWMASLDNLFSGRIDLMHYYYETYSVHPFGYNFSNILEWYRGVYKDFICDNAFAHVLLAAGYIPAVLLIIAYFYTLFYSVEKCEITPGIYGLMLFIPVLFGESGALQICNNFCLLAMAYPILKLDRSNKLLK